MYLSYLTTHTSPGVAAKFTPGPTSIDQVLSALPTSFSILASVGVVFVTLYFTSNVKEGRSLIFGVLTFLSFAIGAVWTLFISLLRPMTGTEVTASLVFVSLSLMLLGLGFASLTFAYTIPASLKESGPFLLLLILALNILSAYLLVSIIFMI